MPRENKTIDGVWEFAEGIPEGYRNGCFFFYAMGRCRNGRFHKRTVVMELWEEADGDGPFTHTDISDPKNIHATFDGMLERGYFRVVEDYGTKTAQAS